MKYSVGQICKTKRLNSTKKTILHANQPGRLRDRAYQRRPNNHLIGTIVIKMITRVPSEAEPCEEVQVLREQGLAKKEQG